MSKNSKVEKIQKEIDETKKIMVKNLDQVITRGQKLAKLKDKTQEMQNEAQIFKKNANKLKTTLYWRNVALTLVIAGFAIGGLYGLISGFSWPIMVACSAFGGLITFVISKIILDIKQTYNRLPFAKWSASPEKEEKKLPKWRFLMKFGIKKAADGVDEAALISQINGDLKATEQQEAENTQKLIIRGQKISQLADDTSKLAQKTEVLKEDTHELEKVEEAKSNHYTSILVGMAGFAVGAAYGFFMGYAIPMMLVFGAISGTFTYGLTTLVMGLDQEVNSIRDSFRPLKWLHLDHSADKEVKTLHPLQEDLVKRNVSEMLVQYKGKRNPSSFKNEAYEVSENGKHDRRRRELGRA